MLKVQYKGRARIVVPSQRREDAASNAIFNASCISPRPSDLIYRMVAKCGQTKSKHSRPKSYLNCMVVDQTKELLLEHSLLDHLHSAIKEFLERCSLYHPRISIQE